MPRQILRVICLSIMVFFLVSDMVELMSYLPEASSSLTQIIQRLATIKKLPGSSKIKQKSDLHNSPDKPMNFIDRANHVPHKLGSVDYPEARNPHQLDSNTVGVGTSRIRTTIQGDRKIPVTDADLTESERQQLAELRETWKNLLLEHCLPKLVCELYAANSDRNLLSDAEKGIMALIKEGTIGFTGQVVSKYHFAAHMGQLLVGVDGNGCHNFYPKCPISGNDVVKMAKKVNIRKL